MTRSARWTLWLLCVITIGIVFGCIAVRLQSPGAFYKAPANVPSKPGILLRTEPFVRAVPDGARAWKILYTTTRSDDSPTLASALVVAPVRTKNEPRRLIAWLHGSTGILPECAPSLLGEPYIDIPAIQKAIAQGWVIVATDYVGLGTPGPHPYLIGDGEARSALDSIRAVQQMRDLQLAEGTVIWGASQGGHAALWTGGIASTYARDVAIAGVAAAAPATDLPPLVKAGQNTLEGRIISTMILRAYEQAYADVHLDNYISPSLRSRARSMAGRCLAMPQVLLSAAQSWLTNGPMFSADPETGALGRRLTQNTPRGHIDAPVFIAQGDDDDLVIPAIQDRYVKERCESGQAIDYRRYAGRAHVSLLMNDSAYNEDLVSWTRDRFAGVAAPPQCSTRAGP